MPSTPRRDRLVEVAEDVHLLAAHNVNCYLVVEDGAATLVDTGLPATWPLLLAGLAQLGLQPTDVRGIVLTHAHFDHTGSAARAREELSAPVHLHPADHWLAAHPYRYRHEQTRFGPTLRHPRALPGLVSMVRAGALRVPPLAAALPIEDGDQLDLPGRPTVVATPGHTDGHCALLLPGRGVLLTGDALVTRDPYTAATGPRLVAGAATADSAHNAASLERLRDCGATTLLPGHGEPWHGPVGAAVDEAVDRWQGAR